MLEIIILSIAFFAGQFVYNIIGWGSTIIPLAIGATTGIDVKLLLMITVPIAMVGNIVLLYKLSKHINYEILFDILLPSIFGVMLGALILHFISIFLLIKILALMLLFIIFIDNMRSNFNTLTEHILLFVSGVFQSILGLGVLAVAVTKNKFHSRKEFMSTFAMYFLILNTIRFIQYTVQGDFIFQDVAKYWWVSLVMLVALVSASIMQSNLNEFRFKKLIMVFLLISGIYYLVIY